MYFARIQDRDESPILSLKRHCVPMSTDVRRALRSCFRGFLHNFIRFHAVAKRLTVQVGNGRRVGIRHISRIARGVFVQADTDWDAGVAGLLRMNRSIADRYGTGTMIIIRIVFAGRLVAGASLFDWISDAPSFRTGPGTRIG